MDEVVVTKEKQISNPKGDLSHIMKKSSDGFESFGEAYFTTVHKDDIKGWKKHLNMTLNIVVPVGEVQFVIYNDKTFFSVNLSPKNYSRLTIRPGVWIAFKGVGDGTNLVLNIASIEHDPQESVNKNLEEIIYEW